jgi:hypothetical protein
MTRRSFRPELSETFEVIILLSRQTNLFDYYWITPLPIYVYVKVSLTSSFLADERPEHVPASVKSGDWEWPDQIHIAE